MLETKITNTLAGAFHLRPDAADAFSRYGAFRALREDADRKVHIYSVKI